MKHEHTKGLSTLWRHRLASALRGSLTDDDRAFSLALQGRRLELALFPIAALADLLKQQFKLMNIRKLREESRSTIRQQ